MENVKNDAICHAIRQNQYNPAGGGATMINICTKYGFDSLIISGSYGGHRRHTTDDGRRTTDNARGMA